MAEHNPITVDTEIVTDEENKRQFVTEYNALCDKRGLVIVGSLKVVPTNHGTFELAIDLLLAQKT